MALQLQVTRAALLLVDMQRDFLHPDGFFARQGWRKADDAAVAKLVDNCRRLVDAMHQAGRPVIFVKTCLRPDYADSALAPSWHERGLNAASGALVEGSWGTELMDGLAPEPRDYLVVKKGHDAFLHTHLDRLLSNLQVDHCVVAGGTVTEGISGTVRVGAALGYEQFLVQDAIYWPDSPYLPMLSSRVEYFTTEQVETITRAPSPAVSTEEAPGYALVVVDVQNDFVHPEGAMSRYGFSRMADAARERMVANNRELAKAMRARGWPVIWINIGRRPDGADSAQATAGRRLRPMPAEAHYVELGSWGSKLIDGLELNEGDFFVEKKGHSAFGFTPLHRILRNLRVRRCLVSGGAVNGCLSDTVREGVSLGYEMTLISDATYPADSPYVEMLADLADIRPTESLLQELTTAAVS
jgi:ureidoacrylate peracid hydrolase